MLAPLLDDLSVAREGSGRPRTRPDLLRGDKAYSSRATRRTMRPRGIKTVLTEPRDQQEHRRDRGLRGARPVGLDTEAYRSRNVIERGYSDVKQWRGLATRHEKLNLTYRAGAALRAIIQSLNHLLLRRSLGVPGRDRESLWGFPSQGSPNSPRRRPRRAERFKATIPRLPGEGIVRLRIILRSIGAQQ